KGIANTYLKGKSGPGIYDRDVFAYSTMSHADTVFNWQEGFKGKQIAAGSEEDAFMKSVHSTSFLVFRGDSLLFEQYWGEHQPETVSNSFSAAKTFVALLVGIALEEGKIKSLDEPAGNYI